MGYIFSLLFMLAGLLVMLLAIVGSRGRPQIEEQGRDVVHSLFLFGRRIRPRRIPKREVEEVSIRPVPGRRSENQREVVVRSDKRIIRISGQSIGEEELQWLKRAVQCIIAEDL